MSHLQRQKPRMLLLGGHCQHKKQQELLLFCSFAGQPLSSSNLSVPCFYNLKHLVSTFAAGTYDEDVAKFSFICIIVCLEILYMKCVFWSACILANCGAAKDTNLAD